MESSGCPQDTSAAAAVHVACSTVNKARAAFLTTTLLSEMHEAAEAAHMNTLSTSLFSRRQARAYFSALRAAHAHLSRAPPPKPSVKEVQGPLEGLEVERQKNIARNNEEVLKHLGLM